MGTRSALFFSRVYAICTLLWTSPELRSCPPKQVHYTLFLNNPVNKGADEEMNAQQIMSITRMSYHVDRGG
jgi:hypothetical protein